jgi:DNA-binding MarR family transcriptional regulator
MQAKSAKPLTQAQYRALAEFRYQVRKFLRHMEEQNRELGVQPQQYQLVLAVEGLPDSQAPTIGRLAERLQLNHNSMVELVDRCERRGLLRRVRANSDRRQVRLSVTAEGRALLRQLGSAARQELLNRGPALVESVLHLTRGAKAPRQKTDPAAQKGSTRLP